MFKKMFLNNFNTNYNTIILSGSNTVVCSPTGEILTHPDTRCVPVSCPLFSVPHGDVATDDVIVGSTARVTCHAGYRGNSEVTCLKDGSWDGLVTCELVTCAPYPVLYKGSRYSLFLIE